MDWCLLDYKVLTNADIYIIFLVIIIGNIYQPPPPKSISKILIVNRVCEM